MLAVVETCPRSCHPLLHRLLEERFHIRVAAIYGSDTSVPRFRQILDELAPAAVLISGDRDAFQRRAWLETWRRGHPILFRGETPAPMAASWTSIVGRALALRVAYRSCARFLYAGERSHAHYRRMGISESRLVFSPYAVDTTPFETTEGDRERLRPAARQSLGIADDRLVVLCCGPLADRQSVDRLIEAARVVPEDLRRRLMLLFLGHTERREALVATACLPPAVDLRLVGCQTPDAVSRFHHAADLLVLPGRADEAWGLVVNQALHHGLPAVVSSEAGCGPDLIQSERTGECAHERTPAALAAAIAKAAALASRRDVRDACRARAALYGLEAAAAGIARAYQDVAAMWPAMAAPNLAHDGGRPGHAHRL